MQVDNKELTRALTLIGAGSMMESEDFEQVLDNFDRDKLAEAATRHLEELKAAGVGGDGVPEITALMRELFPEAIKEKV